MVISLIRLGKPITKTPFGDVMSSMPRNATVASALGPRKAIGEAEGKRPLPNDEDGVALLLDKDVTQVGL
jgi:hypothetical protein